ncbi:NACHT domain-containing NTPase [uncultured Eubacterium sp.]|uniref:NACHT domain-containing protein n=1 Tax=uncultured Eubacterium sp. TaxID=165185 RepID=UPI002635C5CB|nr:hypothetical protein [uncultured Eubacterium sp.]
MQSHQEYDLFLSHKSEDSQMAQKVYNMVKILHPEWNIFFDVALSLNQGSPDYKYEIDLALRSSRRLIFVSSKSEYCEPGNGWMFYEVNKFQTLQQNSRKTGFNEEYFGVFLNCVCKNNLRDCFIDTQIVDVENIDDITTDTIAYLLEKKYYTDSNREHRLVINKNTLIDKTIEFTEKKRADNELFCVESISDNLIPTLIDENEKKYDFNGLVKLLHTNNIALIGLEGGSGKTTLLTKLFYFYLDNYGNKDYEFNHYVPIFIDLNTISAKNYPIERYIVREFYGETQIMTRNETDSRMQLIENEFKAEVERPEYLLILDGYNELPIDCKNVFDKQLEDYFNYKNVRIIISGRWFDDRLFYDDLKKVEVKGLTSNQINTFLKNNDIFETKRSYALYKILSIPMYLKMYVDTEENENIQTKSDLLLKYMERQMLKDETSKSNDYIKIWNRICLKHFLPAVAYCFATNSKNDSTFSASIENIEELLDNILNNLLKERYRRYYGREYRDNINMINLKNCDVLDISDVVIDYFTKTCRLLLKNITGEYKFVHQIYRDFFAAYYIVEEIKMSICDKRICASLNKNFLSSEIIEFVVEILKEKAPYYNINAKRWNYDCNENSMVYKLLDISRGLKESNRILVANLIEILKYARSNDLSNCDFSDLDLTKSKLASCVFYHYDKMQKYSATFENSTINVENIFCEKHFAPIGAACIKDDNLAVFDKSGKIKFWNTDSDVEFPTKIINNINFDIKKMLFSNNDNTIIAMSNHEIIKINIPNDFEADCDIYVLFYSRIKLENIIQSDDGTIKYTTAFNHFNPKAIDSTDEEDTCLFYGLNAHGTINFFRDELAIGHFCGYDALKIYTYDRELNDWVEKKFGYSECLNDYILCLEKKLQDYNLYWVFPTDIDYKGKKEFRRTFFVNLHQQFEDRTHKFSKMPSLVLQRIEKELSKKRIRLYPEQKKELWKTADEYTKTMQNLEEKYPTLLSLSGKEINSLEYKQVDETDEVDLFYYNEEVYSLEYKPTEKADSKHDEKSNILLISFIVDRKKDSNYNKTKENRYKSVIVEMDTNDYSTKLITQISSKTKAKAQYSDGKILVYDEKKLFVFNENGILITHIKSFTKDIHSFIIPERKDNFYIYADQFIYEMNKDLMCVNSFEKKFRGLPAYCENEMHNKAFLAKKDGTAIDLDSAATISSTESFQKKCQIGRTISKENYTYKISNDSIILFDNQLRVKEFEIGYKMYVNYCCFMGIRGTLAQNNNLKILHSYGAIVDDFEPSEITVNDNIEHYDSQILENDLRIMLEGLEISKDVEKDSKAKLPFAFVRSEFVKNNNFTKINSNLKNSNLNIWSKIYKGSYMNGLFFTDYSILEWISRLNYATSVMIFNLMEAGIIQIPGTDEYKYSKERVSKRIAQTLNSSYRLLFRSIFSKDDITYGPAIYTLSKYGVKIVEIMIGENTFYHNSEIKPLYIQRKLSLNNWFCSMLNYFRDSIDVQGYGLDNTFESTNSSAAKAVVHAYININGQPVFAESYRNATTDYYKCTEKVQRLCILASDYSNLTINSENVQMKKKPIIVVVGENKEHCKVLNELIGRIKTDTKIIYAIDEPIENDIENAHFEFVDDEMISFDIKRCLTEE